MSKLLPALILVMAAALGCSNAPLPPELVRTPADHLQDLKSGDKSRQISASYWLRNLRSSDKEAIPLLKTVLAESKNPLVLKCVVKALGQIGPAAVDTTPELIACWDIEPTPPAHFLRDNPQYTPKSDDAGWDELLQNDFGVALPLLVEKTIVSFGPAALPRLAKSSGGDSDIVRLWCLQAIGKLKKETTPVESPKPPTDHPTGTPLPASLLAKLKEADPKQQHSSDIRKTCELIGEIARHGSEAAEAVDPLLRLMNAADSADIFRAAISALGKIGPMANKALPVLDKLVKKGSFVAETALSSIEIIDPAYGKIVRARYENELRLPVLPPPDDR